MEKETLKLVQTKVHSSTLGHVLHAPIGLLVDGNLAVYIFWFMSAYVISIRLFTLPEDQTKSYLLNAFSKRYFRLAIPVFASVVFAYLIMQLGFMHNIELAEFKKWRTDVGRFYNFEPNAFLAIKWTLYDTFFAYDNTKTYNGVLWSMQPELWGSLFCFFLFGVFGKSLRRSWFYLAFMLLSIASQTYWLGVFLAGYMLCDYHYTIDREIKQNRTVAANALPMGAFGLLLLIAGKDYHADIINPIVAVLIVYAVIKSPILQDFFASKVCMWLGKTSFGLYLVHWPIICSLGCWLYLNTQHRLLWASTGSLLLSLVIGYIFYLYIDKPSVKWSNQIGKYFSK